MSWKPSVPLCSALDKESFAYESTVHRWPAILTQCIDSIYQASYALSYSRTNQSEKINEGKVIIEKISGLKHDMSRDRPLEKINVIPGAPGELDDGPSTAIFDELIERENPTWFSASWLFAECYLYRLLRSFFGRSQHWKRFDPFSKSKLQTFKSSGNAITALANTIEGLVEKSKKGEAGPESTEEGREVLFNEMAQMSLWGNATDLSLLTSLSYADLQALQTTGKEQQEARAKFILANDLGKAWGKIKAMKGGRVDFVLDNAGFELVSDMIFGDWLLTTPHVDEVVFHPKNMPWFVSDVCPPDFRHTIESLLEPNFFSRYESDNGNETEARHRSVSRSRQLQADPSLYSYNPSQSAAAATLPAGSRELKMPDDAERGRIPHPEGSMNLKAREGSVDASRGRPPPGARTFQMDPAYFKNARSQTISPSRSYVMDSSSFSSLSIHDERSEDDTRFDPANTHARGRSTTVKDETPSSQTPVQAMARRWVSHLESGRFRLSVPVNTPLGSSTGPLCDFWTEPSSYANMATEAPELVSELQKSGLVIFKGDLNYRKLTSDAVWPTTTPFLDAIGPLSGKFDLLSLRTCKADVCVGLPEGREAELDQVDPKWRVNGKWAVIQFSGRE